MIANYPSLIRPTHNERQIEFVLSQIPAMSGRLSRFVSMSAYCVMMEKLGPHEASHSLLLYHVPSTIIGCPTQSILMTSPRLMKEQEELHNLLTRYYPVDFRRWRRTILAADMAIQKRLVDLYALPGDLWDNQSVYSDTAMEIEVAKVVRSVIDLRPEEIREQFLAKMGSK